jgi:hypothetical protein
LLRFVCNDVFRGSWFSSLCAFAPLRETSPKRPSRIGIPVISRKGAKAQRHKGNYRRTIFLDKTNHNGYHSQHFLTLCSGTQGQERDARGPL